MTTKASLIKSVKITKAVLAIMTKIIDKIKPNAEKMKAGLSNDIFATSYANSLAEKGMPYKTAYKQAASMIAQGKSIPEFDAKDDFGDYKAKYDYLSKKVYNVKKDFEAAIKHLIELSSKKY
jgi:argininosuccinate lyase